RLLERSLGDACSGTERSGRPAEPRGDPRERHNDPHLVAAVLGWPVADHGLHRVPRDEQRQPVLRRPPGQCDHVHGHGPHQRAAILLRGDGRQCYRRGPAVERSLRETRDRPGLSGQPPGHPREQERDDPMVGRREQRSARDELYRLPWDDGGLTNGVTYYYEVAATNSIGEGPRSAPVPATPKASGVGTDTTKPTIQILSPVAGATLPAGPTVVTGNASDNVGLALVEVSTDGLSWSRASGTASW